jgi:hypothetical protein
MLDFQHEVRERIDRRQREGHVERIIRRSRVRRQRRRRQKLRVVLSRLVPAQPLEA